MLFKGTVSENVFFWYDYLVLGMMIGGSVAIGIYFGFFDKKQDTKKEYLLGGKSMSVIPVSISLTSSIISGITMMAFPADTYKYGSNYLWFCLIMPFGCFLMSFVFLPIFFKLQLTSIYEYLEKRFDKKCQLFASFSFSLSMLCYNGIVIYIPSLAFSQVMDVHVYYIALILCVTCIFYTTVGGLKTVIWTDAFQFVGMVLSSLGVVIVGFITVGGVENVWNSSLDSGRLDIFEFDMTAPTLWTFLVGGSYHWISYTVINQGFVQKCLALPSLGKARRAIFIYGFGVAYFIFCIVLTGNIMYAKYKDCDPLLAHLVSRHDQLLPYFVVDISNELPGLLGIFMSGCFCAALSTFSSVLNTLASTIYEDFLCRWLTEETKAKVETHILRFTVLITGIVSTLLIFVVEKSVEIIPVIINLQGILMGPIYGLFILGALIPQSTSKAAFLSAMLSFSFLLVVGVGNLFYVMTGGLEDFSKPLSVEGCSFVVNSTKPTVNTNEPFVLFKISPWYHLLSGAIITVVLGVIISFFTTKNEPVNKDLLSPMIHRFIK